MYAKGANSRPSCASRANTGTKLMVIISSDRNSAGPTSLLALPINCQCAAPRGSWPCSWRYCSSCLWAFSTITIAASTNAPIAIAMPPKLIILALIPSQRITAKLINTASGRVITATKVERKCSKNNKVISPTKAISSSNFCRRLSTARSIKAERS
ncbi:MAG: Uncharacterised protein [Pseudidiomarina mangrovi]|nr:MAG: Uncharacterised protein [Pseudidiomarina mangrovi]